METSFSIVPNKNRGKQDFSKIGKGDTEAAIGKLPFEGNTHEMAVQNASQEVYKLSMIWTFPNDEERLSKRSLALLSELLKHKGEGSLFATLASCNFVTEFELEEPLMFKTAFRLFSFDIELTENGMLCFREVLALVFEYLRKVKDEWLAKGQSLAFFDEFKLMSQLSHDVYTVPDQEENTCRLAELMVTATEPTKLIK